MARTRRAPPAPTPAPGGPPAPAPAPTPPAPTPMPPSPPPTSGATIQDALRKYGLWLVVVPIVVLVFSVSIHDWLDDGHTLASPSLSSVAKFANTFWIAILVIGVTLFGYLATNMAIRLFGAQTADRLQAFVALVAIVLLLLGGLHSMWPHLFDSSTEVGYHSQKNCEAVIGENRSCLLGAEWIRPRRITRVGETVALCGFVPDEKNLLHRGIGYQAEAFRAEHGQMMAIFRLFPPGTNCRASSIMHIMSSGAS